MINIGCHLLLLKKETEESYNMEGVTGLVCGYAMPR